MNQKPSVGRTVHFHSNHDNGSVAYAAIITQVNADGSVELCTFGPNSVYFQHNVQYSEEPKAGYWGWPPKV